MRIAKTGDIFVLLTPTPNLTADDFAWQNKWQGDFGGSRTDPLHVSLQRFVCPNDVILEHFINTLRAATAPLAPLSLAGVDLRPLYSAFREKYILKCRVNRDEPFQALDTIIRQTILESGQQPHYRHLAVLITVLEGIAKPISLAPKALPIPVPLFVGSHLVVSQIVGQEQYEFIAEWDLFEAPAKE
jgi:hypothetical protein